MDLRTNTIRSFKDACQTVATVCAFTDEAKTKKKCHDGREWIGEDAISSIDSASLWILQTTCLQSHAAGMARNASAWAFTPRDAVRALKSMTANLTILPIPVDVADRWMALVEPFPVTGPDIFDAQLVATMLANGVDRIYTVNTNGFEQFSEVTVLTP